MKITAVEFEKEDGFTAALKKALGELSESAVESVGASDGFSDNIERQIAASDGIIIFAPVKLGGIGAVCASFFEEVAESGSRAFSGKNCLAALINSGNNARYAYDAASRLLACAGAFDAVRVSDSDPAEIISRLAEDYYRILRQNRKYNVAAPVDINPGLPGGLPTSAGGDRELTDREYERLLGGKKRQTAAELLIKRSDEEQAPERDITEITQFFVERFKKTDDGLVIDPEPSPIATKVRGEGVPAPRVKTVKQTTFSLPHYYNPQLAGGLNAVIQLNVTGAESFECFINISNAECTVEEGSPENRDITVNVDAKVWADILKGKFTAQKAFMTGQLKVRGNFVLLTKFDQLFTLNTA